MRTDAYACDLIEGLSYFENLLDHLDVPVVLLHILEPLEVEGEDGGQPLHPHPLVRLLPIQETVSRESGPESGNVSLLIARTAWFAKLHHFLKIASVCSKYFIWTLFESIIFTLLRLPKNIRAHVCLYLFGT